MGWWRRWRSWSSRGGARWSWGTPFWGVLGGMVPANGVGGHLEGALRIGSWGQRETQVSVMRVYAYTSRVGQLPMISLGQCRTKSSAALGVTCIPRGDEAGARASRTQCGKQGAEITAHRETCLSGAIPWRSVILPTLKPSSDAVKRGQSGEVAGMAFCALDHGHRGGGVGVGGVSYSILAVLIGLIVGASHFAGHFLSLSYHSLPFPALHLKTAE